MYEMSDYWGDRFLRRYPYHVVGMLIAGSLHRHALPVNNLADDLRNLERASSPEEVKDRLRQLLINTNNIDYKNRPFLSRLWHSLFPAAVTAAISSSVHQKRRKSRQKSRRKYKSRRRR